MSVYRIKIEKAGVAVPAIDQMFQAFNLQDALHMAMQLCNSAPGVSESIDHPGVQVTVCNVTNWKEKNAPAEPTDEGDARHVVESSPVESDGTDRRRQKARVHGRANQARKNRGAQGE